MCGDLYRPCRSVTDDGIPGPAAIGHTHTHKGTACFLMHVLRRRASWRLFAVVFFWPQFPCDPLLGTWPSSPLQPILVGWRLIFRGRGPDPVLMGY